MTSQDSTNTGLSLHVSIEIAPDNVPKFFEYFKPVYDHVVAEPECLFFEVYQSPDNPGQISWVENWLGKRREPNTHPADKRNRTKDVQWLQTVQLQKDYYKEYFSVTEPMFLKPREFKLLKRLGKPYYTVKEV